MPVVMKATRVLMAMLAVVAAAGGAWAADGGAGKAPRLNAETPWVAILYTLVATVAICVLGFKNCRRTHLD